MKCYGCDLNNPRYLLNRDDAENFLCERCYDRIIRRPKRFKTNEERNAWQSQQKKGQIPANKGKRLQYERQCYACGSSTTYTDKTGRRHWRLNLGDSRQILQSLCSTCWHRYFANPLYNPRWTNRRTNFRGKEIHLQFNPRTGFCSQCGRVGKTHLHHDHYEAAKPLAHTVELCMSCHMKETWKAKQLTTAIRDKNRPPKKAKAVYSPERYSAHHFAKKLCERKQCHINNQDCNGSLQVAHIDRNPLNNNLNNLVSLCRTHHAIMDNRNLTLEELRDLKLNYYYIKTKRRYLT